MLSAFVLLAGSFLHCSIAQIPSPVFDDSFGTLTAISPSIFPFDPSALPAFPDSVVNPFVSEAIIDVGKWGDINQMFNTSAASASEASAAFYDIIYSKGTLHGVKPPRIILGAKKVAKAVADTFGVFPPLQFAEAQIKTAGDVFLYAKVMNKNNFVALAHEYSNILKQTVQEFPPGAIDGPADSFYNFLNSHNLYTSEMFDVKNEYFVRNLYSLSGVQRSFI